jgi:hypothetical protein
MTSFRPKLWTGVSAAIVIGAAGLSACSPAAEEKAEAPAAPTTPVPAGEGGEGGAEGGAAGEAGAQSAYVSVPAESRAALRLAHLKGFFLIAQKQTEGAEAAAALAGQGMLEVYDPAKGAFDATGVDEAILRKAAASGSRADLNQAINAIDQALAKQGGDPAAVAKGLVSISAGLYQLVIQEGAVDPIEYQHSLGAALSAQQVLAKASGPKISAAKPELDKLIAMWPAPQAPATATPVGQVSAQASRVELALS